MSSLCPRGGRTLAEGKEGEEAAAFPATRPRRGAPAEMALYPSPLAEDAVGTDGIHAVGEDTYGALGSVRVTPPHEALSP